MRPPSISATMLWCMCTMAPRSSAFLGTRATRRNPHTQSQQYPSQLHQKQQQQERQHHGLWQLGQQQLSAIDSKQLRFLDDTRIKSQEAKQVQRQQAEQDGDDQELSPLTGAAISSSSQLQAHTHSLAQTQPSRIIPNASVNQLLGTDIGTASNDTHADFFESNDGEIDELALTMLSNHPKQAYGPSLNLTDDERDLFRLLREAKQNTNVSTTLRVAGGWVRDKLLATPEFSQPLAEPIVERLTSKFKGSTGGASLGRQGTKVLSANSIAPVDIDIALDDMLGREFADRLNEYLSGKGEETISVGVVLKNPEKSKHLETATMKVGSFWIDFVNLRAEQYAQDSRIPDLMRIGTPAEDAFRRDLTINTLFYNINNGMVEDWTGRGFHDLQRGVVATPLAPLTTLLDDPLRTLRSVRFAARLRFTMDEALLDAAKNSRVRQALAEKVSRERVGGEIDLMLRSPDPVGAMRLLINLQLVTTVFPTEGLFALEEGKDADMFRSGLDLLSTTHDHLWECQLKPPVWCDSKKSYTTHGVDERTLMQDEEARRLLWYAAFLKPLYDHASSLPTKAKSARQGKKAKRSITCKLLVDELKRPVRDAEAIEKIMKAADDFGVLFDSGCDLSAVSILLSKIRVADEPTQSDEQRNGVPDHVCFMNGREVSSTQEEDPVWKHAMEFRLLCSKVMNRIGPLWRAALLLSLAEELLNIEEELDYTIEGDVFHESKMERRQGIIDRYNAFAVALQRIGLVGIWGEKPLMDGGSIKKTLPSIPKGPAFRDVMDEQTNWMTAHPGAHMELLQEHLETTFAEYR